MIVSDPVIMMLMPTIKGNQAKDFLSIWPTIMATIVASTKILTAGKNSKYSDVIKNNIIGPNSTLRLSNSFNNIWLPV